jgi:hypothetical protein
MSLNSFYDMTDLKTPHRRCSFLGVRKPTKRLAACPSDQCRGRKPESNHVRGVPRERCGPRRDAGRRMRTLPAAAVGRASRPTNRRVSESDG